MKFKNGKKRKSSNEKKRMSGWVFLINKNKSNRWR